VLSFLLGAVLKVFFPFSAVSETFKLKLPVASFSVWFQIQSKANARLGTPHSSPAEIDFFF
jgi:hypothetical protein